MKSVCLLAASLAAIALPAAAQADLTRVSPGYSYFHRAGADLATHDAELMNCLALAAQTVPFSIMARNAMGRPGLIPWTLNEGERGHGVAANTENCMVVKGWEVVTVSDATGKALLAMSSEEVARDFLAPRVGEPVVTLGVTRSWANDAASPDTRRSSADTPITGKPSISIKGLGDMRIREAQVMARRVLDKPPKGAEARILTGGQVAKIPAGSAVIVVRIRNVSMEHGTGFAFERVSPVVDLPSWEADGQVGRFVVSQGIVGERPEGRFVAVAVPAGEWRLASLGVTTTLNFCLGSPSFRIEAGEVLFAGTFDMDRDPFRPDMETIAARKFLKARPDLAEALRPAAWTNGSTGLCGDNGIYALEFEGAPFAEGYIYGGAAKAAP